MRLSTCADAAKRQYAMTSESHSMWRLQACVHKYRVDLPQILLLTFIQCSGTAFVTPGPGSGFLIPWLWTRLL